MNASITPPANDEATKLPVNIRIPVFSTATFRQIKPPTTPGALIEIGEQPTAAMLAWEREHPAAPQAAPPLMEEKSGKLTWRRNIGSARLNWGKLSSGELERIEGDPAKLIALLLRHYSFDRHEADRQVKNFFQRNRI